jgi:hypothetical protein
MMKHNSLRIGVALIAVLSLFAMPAWAGLVVNPSFESQSLPNDNDIDTVVAGWTYSSSAGGTGIVCNPTGYDEPGNDTAYGFIGASGSGTPLGADGTNVLWEYENDLQFGLFSQVVDTTIQAGNTYTLTVAMGMVPTGGNLTGELIFYTENGDLLSYVDTPVSAMASARFVDGTPLVFTPTPEQVALYGGQKLKISLCGYTSAAGGRIAFDNVRLDVVPEPGTVTLLSFAVLGLAIGAWRKLR